MSFILDALKKSETERQQQSAAEFSTVPTTPDKPNPARWLWLLGILLAINFAVLIGILLKPAAAPGTAAPATASPIANADDFEAQVADAIENLPEPATAQPPPPSSETVTTTVAPTTAATPPAATPAPRHSSIAAIPSIEELRLEGSLQIAAMHLDIHVFSDVPDERFVFINMTKHREGSTTAEGPLVREITPEGVILEHQGRLFLLPRQ